jgi:hypothetical protein
MSKWSLNFYPALLKRKINIKFLRASLKTLINSKYFQKPHPLSVPGFQDYFNLIDRFVHNFQNQSRLSEQLLESQAAIGKPEQAQ